MNKFYLPPVFFGILLLTVSCTSNDAQRDFEREAYSSPVNFTEVSFQGEVISVDENDWRTSPLFQGLVEIYPPYPNPVQTNQPIQFLVGVRAQNAINGLEIITRLPDGTPKVLREIFENLPQGDYPFTINPLDFALDGSVDAARGLNRVYIFNLDGQMISYGDIMVE